MKVLNYLFPILFIWGNLLASSASFATTSRVSVVSVGDGDTVRVKRGAETITVRLACIDSPESEQKPYGTFATERLKDLLPRGLQVGLRDAGKDRYGRTVGEIFVDGKSINLQMVAEGYAVVYGRYLRNCAENKSDYLFAQSNAKANRLEFWSQPNPVMPWDFRRGNKSSRQQSVEQTQSKECDAAYPDFCIPVGSPDLDCGEISQRNFTVLQPDPHGFDRDKDGVGCER